MKTISMTKLLLHAACVFYLANCTRDDYMPPTELIKEISILSTKIRKASDAADKIPLDIKGLIGSSFPAKVGNVVYFVNREQDEALVVMQQRSDGDENQKLHAVAVTVKTINKKSTMSIKGVIFLGEMIPTDEKLIAFTQSHSASIEWHTVWDLMACNGTVTCQSFSLP
ncbi:MAG: hypothetical protein OJI67_24410 [Prosthecobacter sp.]|nr:hypothetical protein [Prosthecobacter sp.]